MVKNEKPEIDAKQGVNIKKCKKSARRVDRTPDPVRLIHPRFPPSCLYRVFHHLPYLHVAAHKRVRRVLTVQSNTGPLGGPNSLGSRTLQ